MVDKPFRKTQLCIDTANLRGFYEALKAIPVPTTRPNIPFKVLKFLTERDPFWNTGLSIITLFSTNNTVQDPAINCISKEPTIAELDVLALLEETVKAIGQLRSNKATGVDGIPPEA